MRSKLTLGTLLAVALAAPAALPCGAPFGNGINADPRQDIVVVHKDGVETYVFQPRFCGSAQEFGLVLPIPAKLSGQPALSQAAVFTHLTKLSQPIYTTVTVCQGRNGVGGSAGGGMDAGMGTSVVSSGTVGFMDYSQLETGSVASLTTWLKTNGYPYDSLAESAFAYYVDKGWYFVAFKVNQGNLSGGSTCKDLGPIKLTFPTDAPVVPTRMATARSKDTTGALAYGNGFSWRIFGITAGTEQLGFAAGESYNRTTSYSGLLVADDVSLLDGLGAAGDRLDKLTVTFNYGSTEPDVALTKIPGVDYREVIQQVSYVPCNDGGVDTIAAPPESVGRSDAGVVAPPDAGVPTQHDAGAPSEPTVTHGGGCALGGAAGFGDVAPLVLGGMLLALVRRRRR